MKKNMWLLLTVGLSLNVAAFASDETASTEEPAADSFLGCGDETASTEEPAADSLLSSLVADGDDDKGGEGSDDLI